MKYQLVLQFETLDVDDFDALVALEDSLTAALAPSSLVDGHDCGSDEFNIFIYTNDPHAAFAMSEGVIQRERLRQSLKAAYRNVSGESFVVLWPPTLEKFSVS